MTASFSIKKFCLTMTTVLSSIICCYCNADDVAMDGFLTRTLKGTYAVTSTVDIVISGQANTDLLVCVPYPESNTYQDIIWLDAIPSELISAFPETGERFIRYARHQSNLVSDKIKRNFIFRCWSIVANLNLVTRLYPYDKNSDTYRIYTRKPEGDNLQIDPSNSWVIAQCNAINEKVGDNPLDYARLAYALVASQFSYLTEEPNLETIIANKGGQCGGLTAVIVSLLRANGIPARPLVCKRPSGSNHVFGEFYLQNYGWVPFDITKDLGKENGFVRFGSYGDNCIIMTRDMHQSVTSEGGRRKIIKLLQSHSFWYWYSGSTTKVSVSNSIYGEQGCLRSEKVFIPYSWIDNLFMQGSMTSSQYEETIDSDLDGDGMCVWQEYVAGSDPKEGNDVFTAHISIGSDGRPQITYSPVFENEVEKARRKYTTYGKVRLDDNDWSPIPSGKEEDYNFFKVTVEMR